MPELPEAETIARGLHRLLVGRSIERIRFRIPRLRRDLDKRRLRTCCCGREILAVGRRGKGILVEFADERSLLVHLGMTGTCRVCTSARPRERHDRVHFLLDDGREWRFADARRFGMLEAFRRDDLATLPDFLRRLGPEPLTRAWSWRVAAARAVGRRLSIKEHLLDQAAVAGIGNIYACEALYRAGIDPRRAAGDLGEDDWRRLVPAIKRVLRAAIRAGGTTVSDFVDAEGKSGCFTVRLRVYGRGGDPCPACGAPIAHLRQGGRSTWFCPQCQVDGAL